MEIGSEQKTGLVHLHMHKTRKYGKPENRKWMFRILDTNTIAMRIWRKEEGGLSLVTKKGKKKFLQRIQLINLMHRIVPTVLVSVDQ